MLTNQGSCFNGRVQTGKSTVRGRVSSGLQSQRALVAVIFLLALAGAATFVARTASAASPSAGAISPAGALITWNGFAANNADPQATEGACQEGVNCDTYKLFVTGNASEWAGKVVRVRIEWKLPTFDYALSVHKGGNTDPVVGYSDNAIDQPRAFEEVDINPSESGTGEYSIHIIYFNTSAQDPYKGTARLATAPAAVATPTPAPLSAEPAPRYFNYVPPAGKATDAGEPSIGINWKTGKVFFISYVSTFRINFDDGSSPARATWEDKSVPTHLTSLDPILFTDPQTGRTFSSQLVGATSLMSFSDNDGESWTPSQGAGIAASVDHQTLGGGPFHAPLQGGVGGVTYPNAVYYCSQDVGVDASCALSVDGGLTFGPAVRIYTQFECEAGLHGHLKVAPDGTAYVPVPACQGEQAVVVSENNGLTWEVRRIPNSGTNTSDPSLGIASDGTVYFAFSDDKNRSRVAVSHDKGHNWTNDFDIGASHGIKNSVFPAAVAGDPDRAAIFFLGSTTSGSGATSGVASDFTGAWHGYIATTYDGGKSWVTVNATAGDPVQRGPICDKGTLGCEGNTRNLLDFNDVGTDKQGRVLAAFADGCISASCIQGNDTNGDNRVDGNDNDGATLGTIIRTAGGKGLFSAYDAQLISNKVAAPQVTASLNSTSTTATVSWLTPDDGGSAINGFNVYRGTDGGAETLLANVAASARTYTDAASGPNFYYRVSGTNAHGEGAKSLRAVPNVSAPVVTESACTGLGVTILTDAAGDALTQQAQHDVRSLHAAEPYGDGSNKLTFTLKMASMSGPLTPNTQWVVYFTGADGKGYFVDMRTDLLGAVSYKYGTYIHNADNTQGTTTTLGNADAGSSYNAQTGEIKLVVSNSKIGNPKAGDTLSKIFVRVPVVAVVPDNANYSSPSAGIQYKLVGNASCQQ